MIERQRMHRDVLARYAGVDHAAHILPEDRVVGELHALRRRFGAAGINDLRHVEALRPLCRRLAARFDQREHIRRALDRRALLLRRQPNEFAHMRRERGGLAGDLSHAAVRGQHARARVVENEGDVVGAEHEIDRNHDRAQPHQRVAQGDKAVRIAGEHRDLVAAPDPARGEARGQPLRDGVKFGIGPADRAAGKAEPARNALGAAPQRVAQRLPAQIGVHGSSPTRARLSLFSAHLLEKVGRRTRDVNQALTQPRAPAAVLRDRL